jgi:hypothetical protein
MYKETNIGRGLKSYADILAGGVILIIFKSSRPPLMQEEMLRATNKVITNIDRIFRKKICAWHTCLHKQAYMNSQIKN